MIKTDSNLLFIPTEIERLIDLACEEDFAGNWLQSQKLREQAKYYQNYMKQNNTEYFPRF